MMFSPPYKPFFSVFGVFMVFGVLSTGCTETSSPQATADRNVTATYQTRGEVSSLPDADKPTSGLFIRHEAIPEFKNQDGEVEGMDTMTMPFPTDDGVDLAPLSVGDKVEVTFEVFTQGGVRGYAATQIDKLPADTELDFSRLEAAGHDHDHHGHNHHHDH
ncbi:MAG: copper-binding protein [Planctomycetota bacterium]